MNLVIHGDEMPKRVRDGGKFTQKGDSPRAVRSIRLTDECWKTLGAAADERGETRADLIERLVEEGAFDEQSDDSENSDDIRQAIIEELGEACGELLEDETLTRGGKDKGVVRRVLKAVLEHLGIDDFPPP